MSMVELKKRLFPMSLLFEDEATTVEFTKTSLTDGKEVEGAKLKVTDESGNTVDEWTSGKEPHIIKELTVGKKVYHDRDTSSGWLCYSREHYLYG